MTDKEYKAELQNALARYDYYAVALLTYNYNNKLNNNAIKGE